MGNIYPLGGARSSKIHQLFSLRGGGSPGGDGRLCRPAEPKAGRKGNLDAASALLAAVPSPLQGAAGWSGY